MLNRNELSDGGSPVDVSLVIKHRLEELGLEQRDLASAVQVTESYISQLLTRKKAPPAPNRTDIYDKIGQFLKLPNGELAKLADLQRREELKRKFVEPPAPLFKEVRGLVLRKCKPDKQERIRAIFEKQPFGELERLVTQKLLDPLIESWDIDLPTFGVEIVLNRRVAPGQPKKFEFVEKEPERAFAEEPGFTEFLRDASLRGDASEQEIEFLQQLRFTGKRPTPLYYYRELQNLRDPLHFRTP